MNDTLVAGPELDARIATEVLRATYTPRFPGDVSGYYAGVDPDGNSYHYISEELPGYSTSLGDTWEVMEHLRRQGWCWNLSSEPPPDENWWVQLWLSGSPGDYFEHATDSLPLAICTVALKVSNRA